MTETSVQKKKTPSKGSHNLISECTIIWGKIVSDDDLRLDGTLTGDIDVTGMLVIGSGGSIEGNVTCHSLQVMGRIKGNICVKGSMSIYETGTVEGDIIVGNITIVNGAKFNGKCTIADEKENT